MDHDITRRSVLLGLTGAVAMTASGQAQQGASPTAGPSSAILLNNVRIFDGLADGLRSGHLLVEGNKIRRISSDPISPPPGATVIDGGGRVLMPGLSDAHWHLTMVANTMESIEGTDTGLMYANTVAEAGRTLLRGFTTVRDVAGPTFGIKAAIDTGVVVGPRVYPSGAMISQTSGHGDMSPLHAVPHTLGGHRSRFEEIGMFSVVNGVPDVLAAVREQLKKGASQIKIAVGGGIFTEADPLDTVQFTLDEIRAVVQAASDWGTYVAAHVYNVDGIRRAIEGGVRCIEHGHMADEETVKLMGERGVWLSLQPLEAGDNQMTPEQAKSDPTDQWDRVAAWAKKHGVKVAFGTDLLFQPPGGTAKHNELLTRLVKVYTPVEVLKMATSGNAELFALSGNRNPYKEAKLGFFQEGAWADMLLVDGDPTTNIDVLRDYDRNFMVIMKDGKIYKNTLR